MAERPDPSYTPADAPRPHTPVESESQEPLGPSTELTGNAEHTVNGSDNDNGAAEATAPKAKEPRAWDWQAFKKWIAIGWRYRWHFLLVVLVSAAYAATSQGRLLLINPVVELFQSEGATNEERWKQVIKLVALLVGLTMIIGPSGFVRQYLGDWITQRIFVDLQRIMQRHLVSLDMSFYIRHRQGDLLTRMTADLRTVLKAINFTARELLMHLFMFIGGLAVAIYASPQMALFCLLGLPIILLVERLSRKVRYWSRMAMAARGEVIQTLNQSMAGVRLIKSFRTEQREIERFNQVTRSWFDRVITAVRWKTLNYSGLDFLYNLLIAAVILFGSWLTIEGHLEIGWFITFLIALVATYDPVRRLTRAVNLYQEGFAASDRVFEVLDVQPVIREDPEAVALEAFQRSVRFENVRFSYLDAYRRAQSLTYEASDEQGRRITLDEDKLVQSLEQFELREIDFEAHKGQITALVGERGSGKSTILDLLLRLYDPSEGRVLIDGIDVRKIRHDSLHKLFAVVTQETFLFHASIAENIAYGNPEATDEEIRQAAADANILSFIENQQDGFDTLVGERGHRLSGGERQSIAIARAIVANAPILVLDEATSNLDSVSEKRIQDALDRLMSQRTVFVVAHRLSTIRNADQILVMQGGRIVERGTHDELLTNTGHYHHLFTTQFAGQDS